MISDALHSELLQTILQTLPMGIHIPKPNPEFGYGGEHCTHHSTLARSPGSSEQHLLQSQLPPPQGARELKLEMAY